MGLTAYDPKKDKLINAGNYQNKTFIKKCSAKHYFKIMQGYGIQEIIIEDLKERGCEKIIIQTSTAVYESSLEDWLAPDIKVADYGHGKQRFLPVKRMRKVA